MKPDEAKAALIDKTVEHAHAKLPPEQAARLEALIRIYYGAVAPEDLSSATRPISTAPRSHT